MTGQRRMGKTSILQELGRRLQLEGWVFLFADVEADRSEEDMIASLAKAIHPVTPIASRFLRATGRRFRRLAKTVDQITAHQLAIRFRGGLDSGNWRSHGENLIAHCAAHPQPVLMVIDEVPIFLARLLREENGRARVDRFLSWLRAVFQKGDASFPVMILSGSIGLAPLVERLGISDRINYLDSIRLRPWDLDTSVQCFKKLMTTYGLTADNEVPQAVYEHLGIGIPQYVQSFFACLRDYARIHGRDRIARDDVAEVYRTELLGPSGQIDLAHYEARLRDGLGDAHRYRLAMEILAEAAVQGTFTSGARRQLEKRHSRLVNDAPRLVTETLEVLVHDGYLEPHPDGHRFLMKLLRDWWKARFRHHYRPLAEESLIGFRENDTP
ncbi:MAG: hypothetical protein OXI71_15605 [Gemmatimonadota bacterium]|nr:hypothetical protein [Gemmatimonadota bacterium]MDE2678049.1 hypothetical protein [Gemmatimonadota bacterium]